MGLTKVMDGIEKVFRFLTLLALSLAMIRFWQAAGLRDTNNEFRINLLSTVDTFFTGLGQLLGTKLPVPALYREGDPTVDLIGFWLLKALQYLPLITMFGYRKHFLLYFFFFAFQMLTDGLVNQDGIYVFLDVQADRFLWMGLVGFVSTL